MKEASTLNVRMEHTDLTITYPNGAVLEAGIIHDVQLGSRARSKRKVLGFVALHRYDVSNVQLPTRRAERLSWFFDQYYRERGGEQLPDHGFPVTDCHSFLSFVCGFTRNIRPGALTFLTAFDTKPPANPAALQSGTMYGIYDDRSYDPLWPSRHSLLAINDGRENLSVIGANGYFAVADNQHLMDFYKGTRISRISGQP